MNKSKDSIESCIHFFLLLTYFYRLASHDLFFSGTDYIQIIQSKVNPFFQRDFYGVLNGVNYFYIYKLFQYDKAINNALATRVRNRINFKGQLNTYRFCDNVWTFVIEEAEFREGTDQKFFNNFYYVRLGQLNIRFSESKS